MDAKDLEKKLQRGYAEMVKNIGEFVEQEGKSLKEAVEAAEDKLSEWEELTREEVTKISSEVRNDLSHFGETWNEAKAYFQERLSLDAEYLKSSIWDQLSGIANKATLDFIEFQKDLQERVDTIVEDFHQDEHKQHKKWHSEHALWLDEVALWQKENKQAEEMLIAIQDAVRDRAVLLPQHEQAIRLHEEVDHKHEKTLAGTESDPSSEVKREENTPEDEDHVEMQELHKEQYDLHMRLKKEQREMMVLINRLNKLLLSKDE